MLLAPSLDEQIPRTCGVREFDRLLKQVDWSEWESAYKLQGSGRPPLHPRYVAGCLLYGLIKKVRSLRELEEATRMRLDFMWLLDDQTVDHTTLCYFRKRFDSKIKDLFIHLNRRAARQKQMTLEDILIDGTRMRADSDRHGARTAKNLEARLEALEAQWLEAWEMLQEESTKSSESTVELEKRIKEMDERRVKIMRALEVARERDQAKRAKDGAKAHPVRVPVTDPDAHIMPNKEGGYAPNYTPVLAVDGESGLIGAVCLAEGNNEAATVDTLIEQAREVTETTAKRVLCDSGFSSGANLQKLSDDGVTVFAPAEKADPQSNPAIRSDPTQPVPEAERTKLPMYGKYLGRDAFIYNSDDDLYRCPMGHKMPFTRNVKRKTSEETITIKEYRCFDCIGCPLFERCVKSRTRQRTVSRDVYESHREELARRMQTEEARRIYARRAPIGEGVFANLKRNMGIRRFTRRGRKRVEAELLWIAIAYNLRKMIHQTTKHQKPVLCR